MDSRLNKTNKQPANGNINTLKAPAGKMASKSTPRASKSTAKPSGITKPNKQTRKQSAVVKRYLAKMVEQVGPATMELLANEQSDRKKACEEKRKARGERFRVDGLPPVRSSAGPVRKRRSTDPESNEESDDTAAASASEDTTEQQPEGPVTLKGNEPGCHRVRGNGSVRYEDLNIRGYRPVEHVWSDEDKTFWKAIRISHPDQAVLIQFPGASSRFEKLGQWKHEVAVTERISEANVAHVVPFLFASDDPNDDGGLYIVTRLPSGRAARFLANIEREKTRQVYEKAVFWLTTEVATALEGLHEIQVTHGKVDLNHVWYELSNERDEAGNRRVIFMLLGFDHAQQSFTNLRRVHDHMAPELWNEGRLMTPAADVWSLYIVLARLMDWGSYRSRKWGDRLKEDRRLHGGKVKQMRVARQYHTFVFRIGERDSEAALWKTMAGKDEYERMKLPEVLHQLEKYGSLTK